LVPPLLADRLALYGSPAQRIFKIGYQGELRLYRWHVVAGA